MARHERPCIGVTGPDEGGWPAWFMTRLALWRAGASARRITPSRPCEIDGLDGLVIGGGADVDPAIYDEELMLPQFNRERKRLKSSVLDFLIFVLLWGLRSAFSTSKHQTGDHARDRLETRLVREGIARGLPVFGICRGMQILNVSFGGSLHQEIADFYEEHPQLRTVLPKKKVEIEPGSKLHEFFGRTLVRVNSLHHQSVKQLGKGMHITAMEPNGIVQGIENKDYPFVMGVQWHPEYIPQDARQQRIFRELVKAAVTNRLARVSPTGFLAAHPDGVPGYDRTPQP